MALEIERRWLVEPPDWIEFGGGPAKLQWLSIVQYYLEFRENKVRRIRFTTELSPGTSFSTHYTEKTDVSPGVCEEVETEIPVSQYLKLLLEKDPNTVRIHKYRYVFAHKGLKFELDKFTDPIKLWILECELPSLTHDCPLPPSIKILEEITGNKKLSNYGIATGRYKNTQ